MAARVDVAGLSEPVPVTRVPPILGRSTLGAPMYEAVVLLVVPSNPCKVAPTVGSHCARGTRASAAAAETRATALRSAGWWTCAKLRASSSVIALIAAPAGD